MLIKQLSVFVENKPGRLAEITEALADNKVDIRALSIADTTDFGILRLIVNEPLVAEKALKDAGFTVSLTDVIAIGVSNKPGGLAKALKVMFDNHIPVEYMYAFISKQEATAYVILRVEDNKKAIEILNSNSFKVLCSSELFNM